MYYYTALYGLSSNNLTASAVLSYLLQSRKTPTRKALSVFFGMTERGMYKVLTLLQRTNFINKDLSVNWEKIPDEFRSRYVMVENDLIPRVGLSSAIYASWAKNRILGKKGREYRDVTDRQACKETTLTRRTLIRCRVKLRELGILDAMTSEVRTENVFTSYGEKVMVDLEETKRKTTKRHAKKYEKKPFLSREEIAHVFITACTRTSYPKAPPPTKKDTMKVYRIQQNMLKMDSPVKVADLIKLMVERWMELQTLKITKPRTPDLKMFPLFHKELYQMVSDKPRRQIIVQPLSVPEVEDTPEVKKYKKIFY